MDLWSDIIAVILLILYICCLFLVLALFVKKKEKRANVIVYRGYNVGAVGPLPLHRGCAPLHITTHRSLGWWALGFVLLKENIAILQRIGCIKAILLTLSINIKQVKSTTGYTVSISIFLCTSTLSLRLTSCKFKH